MDVEMRTRKWSPVREDAPDAPATAASAGLVAEHLTAGYGALHAIRDVSVQVGSEQLVGIVGPNGAGKTTLLRALAGVIPLTGGTVRWRGQDVGRAPADARARGGIAFVQEGRHLFGSLSVRDNLLIGSYGRKRHKQLQEGVDRVFALFPPLAPLEKRTARTLSGGEQQMVAIGRALMGEPSCLLIDEPSLGLAPLIVDAIYRTLPELCRAHMSIAIVEQEVERILHATDYVYVMRDGVVVHHGRSDDLRDDPSQIANLYLGGE
jgi:branched-chain amino acid transport system ATP-binding protein